VSISYNKITLVGRLGKDPEHKKINDKSVTKLQIATNNGYGEKQTTTWHTVIVWDKLADNCAQFLKAGDEALVDGRYESRTYVDKNGNKQTVYEVRANTVQFGAKKNSGAAQPATTDFGAPSIDDIPF
jgi:single-strand DNA-binding protein